MILRKPWYFLAIKFSKKTLEFYTNQNLMPTHFTLMHIKLKVNLINFSSHYFNYVTTKTMIFLNFLHHTPLQLMNLPSWIGFYLISLNHFKCVPSKRYIRYTCTDKMRCFQNWFIVAIYTIRISAFYEKNIFSNCSESWD